KQIGDAVRDEHTERQLAKASAAFREKAPFDLARDVQFHRPCIDANCVVENSTADDVISGKTVESADPSGFPDSDLRCDLDDMRVLEARYLVFHETEIFLDLPPAFDLTGAELQRVGRVHGAPLGVADLRDVGAPFRRILLRTHDRALAREAVALASD